MRMLLFAGTFLMTMLMFADGHLTLANVIVCRWSHFFFWLHLPTHRFEHVKKTLRDCIQGKAKTLVAVYNCFFCRNWLGNDAPTWRHFTCSLKKEEVGYCGRLSWVRGSALFAERERDKKVSVPENGGEHWSTSSNKFLPPPLTFTL